MNAPADVMIIGVGSCDAAVAPRCTLSASYKDG